MEILQVCWLIDVFFLKVLGIGQLGLRDILPCYLNVFP